MSEPKLFGDRYELRRKIARGGMADVYLAQDTSLNRPVAVKVLFPEFATDPSFVQRFRREAQAAANLSHPGIVPVYDWGEDAGTYFIVMEYVEGRSLAEILRDQGPLHPDRAADVTADIASALGFAHRNGVIHRDVKPGNVLISPTGTVKVTDFGIARAVSAQENLTQTGTVMGTATYFSPEQAQGQAVDQRSDVYALGIVLYEILTGKPPFSGDTPVAVAYKHVQETPEPPRQRNADIPAALEAITLKAIAKNPANRYATAEDLRADLRRFRQGQAVVAEGVLPPPTVVDQATRAQDATRVAAGTAALPPVGPPGYETYERYDEGPPERRSRGPIIALVVGLLLVAVAAAVVLSQILGDEELVAVPSVLTLTEEVATDTLEQEGFTVAIELRENAEVDEGLVFEQRPPADSQAEEGSEVTIVVSSGQPPVEVPNVVGDSQADAEATLVAAGLVPEVRTEPADAPAGQVVRQSPQPGSELRRNDPVRLFVSAAPTRVAVPNVVGDTLADATNELEDANLDVRVTQEQSDEPAGRVIRTDPSAGTEVDERSRVTVVVSTGRPTTTTTTTTTTTAPPPSTTTTSSTTTTTAGGGGGGGGGGRDG